MIKELTKNHQTNWVGRFAPSPSGPLHLGSLVAAVASYMIAKQKGGQWLVRIEDLDPPREVKGAAKNILASLEEFGLHWDGEVVYQSQRSQLYQQRLEELMAQSIVYPCDCSRKEIENRSQGIYDGFCKNKKLLNNQTQAIRIDFSKGKNHFYDEIQKQCSLNSASDCQDFIIKRKDGLFAYQLAVVSDDIEQGINHVVRGKDILDSTPRQNFLYQCFSQAQPQYFHVPLVKNDDGSKLSKSLGSTAINKPQASKLLLKA